MPLPAEDELDIIRLINCYARATSDCDPDAWTALFTEDAIWERKQGAAGTKYDEVVVIRGRAALHEFAAANLKKEEQNLYVAANWVIDGRGDAASARSTIIILNLGSSPASVYVVGTFEDELRKGPDGWKFVYRGVSLMG